MEHLNIETAVSTTEGTEHTEREGFGEGVGILRRVTRTPAATQSHSVLSEFSVVVAAVFGLKQPWFGGAGSRGGRGVGAGLAGCLAMLFAGCGDPASKTPSSGSTPASAASAVVAQAVVAGDGSTAKPQVNGAKLVGRWLRPDGGYILEVKSVDSASGKMDVAYLNPRPIHVAQAEAKEAEGKLTVFVELQDVGYPGSTYRLTYLPPVDQMIGTYYQPAADQSFEVEFVRVP